MFFKLVSRNSRRSRKENGLFFSSLLISIMAFYMILSLSNQDVIRFLKEMESAGIEKLLLLVPLFYGLTLFILFFLIYYASRFQLKRREHEFGVYLMMGMSRGKLFFMLLAEDLRSSLGALFVGLPCAVLLSELISLITARLVGLGIIGHRFSFSLQAVLFTAVGFLLIKLLAFLILSVKITGQEVGTLLHEQPEGAKKTLPGIWYLLFLAAGLLLLVHAFYLVISGLSWMGLKPMAQTLAEGVLGMLLFFGGLRYPLGWIAGRKSSRRGLQVFNFRQLEETVIHRSSSLAISSMLILAALCCFGTGIAISCILGTSETHTLDYTFRVERTDLGEDATVKERAAAVEKQAEKVEKTLEQAGLREDFSDLFAMRMGDIRTAEDPDQAFGMEELIAAVQKTEESDARTQFLNLFGEYPYYPELISLTSYNKLLEQAGMPAIVLKEGEAAVYMDRDYTSASVRRMLNDILETGMTVRVDQETFRLKSGVYSVNPVTDRSITLALALIVPDAVLMHDSQGDYSIYLDGVLKKETVQTAGLMQTIRNMNQELDQTGLTYESFLQNMGRQLFYVVAASYITIYLAIIFLVVANTIIGVQFLMSQQKTGRRYQTLIRLGAVYEVLRQSANTQINWYFGIPVAVAATGSLFGVRGLLKGLLSSAFQEDFSRITQILLVSAAMIALLCVVELLYMHAVKRSSSRYLLSLMVPEREE